MARLYRKPLLSLPLFMAPVGADDTDHPFTTDDLALRTNGLDGRSHFHVPFTQLII